MKELISRLNEVLKNLLLGTKNMVRLAWETDRKTTLLYYGTAAFGALMPVLVGVLFKYFLDYLIPYSGLATGVPLIGVALLAGRYIMNAAQNLVLYGINRTYLDYLLRYKLQNSINSKFAEKMLHLDIPHLENPEVQKLIAKTRDTKTWRPPDFMRYLGYLFASIVGYLSAFIVLMPFGLFLPLFITIVNIPRLILRVRHGSIQWSLYGSGATDVHKLWYLEYITAEPKVIMESRIFQSQPWLLERYRTIQKHLYEINKKTLDKFLRVLTIPAIFEMLVLLTTAALFLPKVLDGSLSIGSYTLLIGLIDQLSASASSIASQTGDLYENNFYVKQLFDVLNLPKVIKETKTPVRIDAKSPPLIEFKNVTFSYPRSSQPTLNNLSFIVEPGQSIAFVGPNGAGKTTIIKLLCRFYDVSSGEILINGTNIKDLSLDDWYQCLSTLFQDFVKYNFPIKDNISLSRTGTIDLYRMEKAAQNSGAAEFINNLPNTYDQGLGNEYVDGVDLSIGQWQKLAIARAFYENSPILILDEPTSAVDAEAEAEIFANLNDTYKDKTLIFVSHRFSTVRYADNIFVVEHGHITESGTHTQLMALEGKYATMFATQAEGYRE